MTNLTNVPAKFWDDVDPEIAEFERGLNPLGK
jgi:hypothetical protein